LKAVLEVRKPSILGELIIAITFISHSGPGRDRREDVRAPGPDCGHCAALLPGPLHLCHPVLCALILRPQPEKESFIMEPLRKIYLPVLRYTMKKRKPVLATAGVFLLLALLVIPRLGTEFIPIMDEGAFDMDVSLLPGVSLDKAMEINKRVGEKLKTFPELQTVVSRTGQTGVALDTRGSIKPAMWGF